MHLFKKIKNYFLISKKPSKYTLFIILLLGFILRTYNLPSSITLDESVSLQIATQSILTVIFFFDPTPPLYYLFLRIWSYIFTGLSGAYSLSIIFGVANIYLIYILTKLISNKYTAYVASFLTAISPPLIFYSQELRSYSLFFLLTTLTTYLFFCYIKSKYELKKISLFDKFPANTKKIYFLLIVLSSLLLYTHLYSVFIISAMMITYFFFSIKYKKNMYSPFYTSILLLLIYSPWLIRTYQLIIAKEASWIVKPNIDNLIYLANTLVINQLSSHIVTPIILILGLLVLYSFKSKNKYVFALLFIASFTALVPFIISLLLRPFFTEKYALVIIVLLIPIISISLTSLKSKKLALTLFLAIALTLFLFSIIQGNTSLKEDWKTTHEITKNLLIEEQYYKIIIYPYYNALPYSYYSNNSCFEKKIKPVFTVYELNNSSHTNIYDCLAENNVLALKNKNIVLPKKFIFITDNSIKSQEGQEILKKLQKNHNLTLINKNILHQSKLFPRIYGVLNKNKYNYEYFNIIYSYKAIKHND
ncbi:MAG: hypothetical protein ACMXX6_00605 [Candidatus Woesearchaeota archaeon]